jgi:hypothetical protein
MPRVYHAIHRSVATQHGNLRRVSPDWILAQGVGDGLGLGGAEGRGCRCAWGWAGCWPAGRYGALVARWRGHPPFGAGVLLEDGEPVPPPCPAGDSEHGGVQARASCVAVVGIRTAAAVARAIRPRRAYMSVASVRGYARMTIHGTRILLASHDFRAAGVSGRGALSTTRAPLPRLRWCIRCAQPVPRLPSSPRLRSHGQPYVPSHCAERRYARPALQYAPIPPQPGSTAAPTAWTNLSLRPSQGDTPSGRSPRWRSPTLPLSWVARGCGRNLSGWRVVRQVPNGYDEPARRWLGRSSRPSG